MILEKLRGYPIPFIAYVLFLIFLAGMPPHISPGGIFVSFVTTVPAAIIELFPISTPGRIIDFIPTVIANQQSRSVQIILENQIAEADIYYIKDNEKLLKNIAFNYFV